MEINPVDFMDNRIEDIAADLRKTNGEYAKAVERRKELTKNVNNIIMGDRNILLAEYDRLEFREYFEKEFAIAAIEQKGDLPARFTRLRYYSEKLGCIGVKKIPGFSVLSLPIELRI